MDSNTFWMISGTTKIFTKSGPVDPVFRTNMLQRIQEKRWTHLQNILFSVSQHVGNPKNPSFSTLPDLRNVELIIICSLLNGGFFDILEIWKIEKVFFDKPEVWKHKQRPTISKHVRKASGLFMHNFQISIPPIDRGFPSFSVKTNFKLWVLGNFGNIENKQAYFWKVRSIKI